LPFEFAVVHPGAKHSVKVDRKRHDVIALELYAARESPSRRFIDTCPYCWIGGVGFCAYVPLRTRIRTRIHLYGVEDRYI
jgi:hypothetical protein